MYPQQTTTGPTTSNRNAQIIGQWRATDYGLPFGKHLEFIIERIPTARGGTFETFSIFKPYIGKTGPKAGLEGKGFSFPFNATGLRELVDTINKMIAMFGTEKGMFVWQPMPQQVVPVQQQYGAPPQYGQQPNYAPQPQYSAPPQPQYAPVPPHQGFTGYQDGALAPAVGNPATQPMPQQQPANAPAAPAGYAPYPGQR